MNTRKRIIGKIAEMKELAEEIDILRHKDPSIRWPFHYPPIVTVKSPAQCSCTLNFQCINCEVRYGVENDRTP